MKFVEWNNFIGEFTKACQTVGEVEIMKVDFVESLGIKNLRVDSYVSTTNIDYRFVYDCQIESEDVYINIFMEDSEGNQTYFDTKEELVSNILTLGVISCLSK